MNRVIEGISERFNLTSSEARYMIMTAPVRYKEYPIKKASGKGVRIIAQPTSQVKQLQRFVISNLLSDLPVHDCAYAYVINRSIKDNAQLHSSSRYLLKMDFSNFFPSIQGRQVAAHIRKHSKQQYSNDEIKSLISICLRQKREHPFPHLSIGAPSSPFLSNSILFDFDEIISRYCKTHGIIYTRYADDLTFSTTVPNLLLRMENYVETVLGNIDYPKLSINKSKTIHTSKKRNRKVTGLTISNSGKASVGRDRKRIISAMVHKASLGKMTPDELQILQGQLGFIKFVDYEFLASLKRKYGSETVTKIQNGTFNA